MGLHLNYELALSADVSDAEVQTLVAQLHARAGELPFAAVTDVVRLTGADLVQLPPPLGPRALQLEHVANLNGIAAREELYARAMGISEDQIYERRGNQIIYHPVQVPPHVKSVAYAFSIGVGVGSEPASLGVLQVSPDDRPPSQWWWRCFCKTQYASVHGDDHLVRCHKALVDLLDAAQTFGFDVQVHDETGYWESRDAAQLIATVGHMNQVIAQFAGSFTDAARAAGHDSRAIQGEIFRHPDFERLETGSPSDPEQD